MSTDLAFTTIQIERDSAGYRAMQDGVDVVGRGDTPQLAVAHFAEAMYAVLHGPETGPRSEDPSAVGRESA